jgi:uncharacterized cofD-like protein
MSLIKQFTRWFKPGLGIKRWFLLFTSGVLLLALTFTFLVVRIIQPLPSNTLELLIGGLGGFTLSITLISLGVVNLVRRFLEPYRKTQDDEVYDTLHRYSLRGSGLKVVAIGGGTGMPSVLRALKPYTHNITAIVTMADDGGSSGRLRQEMGALPPGDLRNNIVALADDESLMAKLFQYRFETGDMKGHAFGNLFISALEAVAGSLESALIETERVLNIEGRVFPSTMENVRLSAWVIPPGKDEAVWVEGESNITHMSGSVQQLCLEPTDAPAYTGSVEAIVHADVVIIGPGSLYTSILPNLLVQGVADALRATDADIFYVCNVATQPGETEGFTVADHVLALEKHIGRGVFNTVLANNAYPSLNAGENTRYVAPVPPNHEIVQRYEIIYSDLVDAERPWRHDPAKLAKVLFRPTPPP